MTVLEIIKTIGLYSLVSNDGCPCGNFSIQGVGVDISCGRGGERAIRLYRTLDIPKVDLHALAEEIKKQADDAYGRDLPVFFETFQDSREYRALEAWRAAPGNTKYEDFIKTFEVHK